MTFRIPSSMVEQDLTVDSVTADSVNGVTDLASFLSQQKSTNGYQVLPGGLILQWGYTTGGNLAPGVSITFPVTFPNNILYADCVAITNATINSSVATGQQAIDAPSTSGMTARLSAATGFWFALGY